MAAKLNFKESHALLIETFPSDAFMEKYFGEDPVIEGFDHITFYRDLFEMTLHTGPRHWMRTCCKSGDLAAIYLFKDGACTPQTRENLQEKLDLPPEADAELCTEFIQHYAEGHLVSDCWWRWKATEDSIWMEVIPEKIAEGYPKRRTLSELFPQK